MNYYQCPLAVLLICIKLIRPGKCFLSYFNGFDGPLHVCAVWRKIIKRCCFLSLIIIGCVPRQMSWHKVKNVKKNMTLAVPRSCLHGWVVSCFNLYLLYFRYFLALCDQTPLKKQWKKECIESKQNKTCYLWKSNLKQVVELWLDFLANCRFRGCVVLCGHQ